MTGLLLDLRFALRSFGRRPWLGLSMVLTLGLGFGATTAIYSYVEATVLDPLPFADAESLVMVSGVFREEGGEPQVRGASAPEVADWRQMTDSYETLAAVWNQEVTVAGEGEAERLGAAFVEPGYLALLGVGPVAGRALVAADDAPPGGLPVAVVSHDLWQRRYGADPRLLGRTIGVDGRQVEVVGVLPAGFHDVGGDRDLWLPLRQAGEIYDMRGLFDERGGRWLGVAGRLRPEVTVAQAQAEIDGVAANLERQHPDSHLDRGALVADLESWLIGDPQRLLLMLMAAVGLVWLLASVNVAGLMIARIHERTREIAVRSSLGASPWRLFRGIVLESVLLGAAGAMVGLLLAAWGVQLLQVSNPLDLPAFLEVGLGPEVMGFAAALAVATGLLIALLATARVLRPDLVPAIKAGGDAVAAGAGGRRPLRLQNALVVLQVATAVVVLVGAGLVTRSLLERRSIDPGFDTEGLLALRVQAPRNATPEQNSGFARELLDGVAALPGVERAALSSDLLLSGGFGATYAGSEADVSDPERRTRIYYHRVTPGFFATLGIDVDGPGFSPPTTDGEGPFEVVVAERLARKLWPGGEALGQPLVVGGGEPATVVGVAEEVLYRQLVPGELDSTDPDVYLSYFPRASASPGVVLRLAPAAAEAAPQAVVAGVRELVARLDPESPVFDVATVDELLGREVAGSRFTSQIFTVFALLAMVLAGLGVYGVMAYSVSRRRREMGIRTALGAAPRGILAQILSEGARVTGLGLFLGLGAALFAARLLGSLLYGVAPHDPGVLAAVTIFLLAVGLAASYLPARRASRISPLVSLRER